MPWEADITGKKFLLSLLLAGGLSCTGRVVMPDGSELPEGAYKLSSQHSRLSAVALKNEQSTVTVRFPELKGYATFGNRPSAFIQARVSSLYTGQTPGRDMNLRQRFFEVDQKASYEWSSFRLHTVEGNLEGMAPGVEIVVQASGDLVVHDTKVRASGQVSLVKGPVGETIVRLEGPWNLSIKALGMEIPLKNLNAFCPQPHRVADTVRLEGKLVFVP